MPYGHIDNNSRPWWSPELPDPSLSEKHKGWSHSSPQEWSPAPRPDATPNWQDQHASRVLNEAFKRWPELKQPYGTYKVPTDIPPEHRNEVLALTAQWKLRNPDQIARSQYEPTPDNSPPGSASAFQSMPYDLPSRYDPSYGDMYADYGRRLANQWGASEDLRYGPDFGVYNNHTGAMMSPYDGTLNTAANLTRVGAETLASAGLGSVLAGGVRGTSALDALSAPRFAGQSAARTPLARGLGNYALRLGELNYNNINPLNAVRTVGDMSRLEGPAYMAGSWATPAGAARNLSGAALGVAKGVPLALQGPEAVRGAARALAGSKAVYDASGGNTDAAMQSAGYDMLANAGLGLYIPGIGRTANNIFEGVSNFGAPIAGAVSARSPGPVIDATTQALTARSVSPYNRLLYHDDSVLSPLNTAETDPNHGVNQELYSNYKNMLVRQYLNERALENPSSQGSNLANITNSHIDTLRKTVSNGARVLNSYPEFYNKAMTEPVPSLSLNSPSRQTPEYGMGGLDPAKRLSNPVDYGTGQAYKAYVPPTSHGLLAAAISPLM